MLPITEIPSFVSNHENLFSMLSFHQRLHLRRYVTGLATLPKTTISYMNSVFVDEHDQSAMNRFLTEGEWDERELNDKRFEYLQTFEQTRCKKSGVVALDDTIAHKTGEKIEGVSWLFDHCEDKTVLGHSIVSSHYVDKEVNYPIDYRFYFSNKSDYAREHTDEFKTKIQLALELIEDAVKKNAGEGFVMDSWFVCEGVTSVIDKHKKFFVGRIKSDRLVHTRQGLMQIGEFAKSLPQDAFKEIIVDDVKYRVFRKVMKFKSLPKKVRVVISHMEGIDDPVFIVTNQLGWDEKKAIETYSMRSKIDSFYKDAKQNFGLEDCQLRSLKGVKRHWYMVFLAYTLVKLSLCRSRLSGKANAASIGEGCRLASRELLEKFVYWVCGHAKEIPASKILDLILM